MDKISLSLALDLSDGKPQSIRKFVRIVAMHIIDSVFI